MKSAILALQFMTRLPLPSIAATPEDFGRAIRWFPLAGAVVGAGIVAAGWLGVQRDPALGAILAVATWVGLTGALHLDGLGDMADAAGAAHGDPKRVREVLADPHLGSFGVTAIALQILAKFVLAGLVLKAGMFAALALVPILARIGPIVWARWLPPLHEGLGTMFRQGATLPVPMVWLLAWCLCAMAIAPLLLVAVPVLGLWPLWLRARIGGISGDGHGAGIELVETAALLALVLAR